MDSYYRIHVSLSPSPSLSLSLSLISNMADTNFLKSVLHLYRKYRSVPNVSRYKKRRIVKQKNLNEVQAGGIHGFPLKNTPKCTGGFNIKINLYWYPVSSLTPRGRGGIGGGVGGVEEGERLMMNKRGVFSVVQYNVYIYMGFV